MLSVLLKANEVAEIFYILLYKIKTMSRTWYYADLSNIELLHSRQYETLF